MLSREVVGLAPTPEGGLLAAPVAVAQAGNSGAEAIAARRHRGAEGPTKGAAQGLTVGGLAGEEAPNADIDPGKEVLARALRQRE